MKKYLIKHYNRFFALMWVVIILLFWFRYIHIAPFLESVLYAVGIFTPLILSTTWLSSHLLPQAIRSSKMSRFVFQFFFISLICSIFLVCLIQCVLWLETEGFLASVNATREQNPFWLEIIDMFPSVFVVNLGFCGLRFYFEHSLLEQAHLETQLQVLKQQINPHFMFNVLNHIHTLMHKDVAKSSDLLLRYADILRYQLYQGEKDKVSIEKEIEFMKNYIEVEKVRWGETVDVRFDVSVIDTQKEIPTLLMITLLENAFKHVLRTIGEKSKIDIRLMCDEQTLSLTVKNTASEIPIGKPQGLGLGLANLHDRLEILYPSRYELNTDMRAGVFYSCLKIQL